MKLNAGDGITLKGGDSTVKGFTIVNFKNGAGIDIDGELIVRNRQVNTGNNTIVNDYIGIYKSGKAGANEVGVKVEGSSGNTIGGKLLYDEKTKAFTPANVISDNSKQGILLTSRRGTPGIPRAAAVLFSNGNTIVGDYIGVAADGKTAAENDVGIEIRDGGSSNIIGTSNGFSVAGRNVISGNKTNGVVIHSSLTNAAGAVIQAKNNKITGNFIGTDVNGTIKVPNKGNGILLDDGADGNQIGGDSPVYRNGAISVPANVISGNGLAGIRIQHADNITVYGSFIGVSSIGIKEIKNTTGISVFDSIGDTFGEFSLGGKPVMGAYNVIANGISLTKSSGNKIVHNYLGLSREVLGNESIRLSDFGGGITIAGTADSRGEVVNGKAQAPKPNVIGGVSPAGGPANVISGIVGDAIEIVAEEADPSKDPGNIIINNYIGTDLDGVSAVDLNGKSLGNINGIKIDGVPNNKIGDVAGGPVNVVSANTRNGIVISGKAATGNDIFGAYIGLNKDGNEDPAAKLGNGQNGIVLENGAHGNVVSKNTIWYNGGAGVRQKADAGVNIIDPNSIGRNTGLGIDIGPPGVTPNSLADVLGLQTFPVLGAAYVSPASTMVEWSVHRTLAAGASAADQQVHLEFFANPSPDPSGYGQGETFIGAVDVTLDANGNASGASTFSAVVPAGYSISATATSPTRGTSEFSADVVALPAPVLDPIANQTAALGMATTFTATAHDPDGDHLTFSLIGAPAGAAIDPNTGVFTWSPSLSNSGDVNISTHTFTVRVTDSGTPNLYAQQAVTVTVYKWFPFTDGTGASYQWAGQDSIHMMTGPGNGKVYLGTDAYNGMLVSSLTSLSYTTLINAAQPGVAPYINLYVDGDGDGTYNPASGHDDLLVFDPTKNGTIVMGTAQTWNALSGQWYGFHGVLAGTISSGNTISLSQLPATARIIAPFPPSYPGLSFVAGSSSAGSWSNFDGSVLSTSVTLASPPMAMVALSAAPSAPPLTPSGSPAITAAPPAPAKSAISPWLTSDGDVAPDARSSRPPQAQSAVSYALPRAKKGLFGVDVGF